MFEEIGYELDSSSVAPFVLSEQNGNHTIIKQHEQEQEQEQEQQQQQQQQQPQPLQQQHQIQNTPA